MKREYRDIMQLERPISKKHPPMERRMRAAQFAPFAALSGHEDAVQETARLTEEEIELDEYEIAELNRSLQWLQAHPGREASIVHFVKDAKKEGGAYKKTTGVVQKVDEIRQQLVLTCQEKKVEISIPKIIEILI